ncbi:hypothetical protein ATANTOWER_030162 [Ataeniobius toweri]|uniref:Uncharacterized protein n=1 Tax=Ataeniobius toweri TaxID=208326 RepID=A0ABU7C4U4_9TELE|nr:hypothetical protein [Ataeniobius toweri]
MKGPGNQAMIKNVGVGTGDCGRLGCSEPVGTKVDPERKVWLTAIIKVRPSFPMPPSKDTQKVRSFTYLGGHDGIHLLYFGLMHKQEAGRITLNNLMERNENFQNLEAARIEHQRTENIQGNK